MHIHISVDVEADGPTPINNSMLEIGAVVVNGIEEFHCYLHPMPLRLFDMMALNAIGVSRQDTLRYPDWMDGINSFRKWLNSLKGNTNSLVFWSDNPGFDWQYINAYFHATAGGNPFGFSSRRIGDYYAGLMGDVKKHTHWKKFRKTKHTHNALDDARGNAEALRKIFEMGCSYE